jgi:endogenous inhibitor of DNA gyrase (YacG/DUF329 family)
MQEEFFRPANGRFFRTACLDASFSLFLLVATKGRSRNLTEAKREETKKAPLAIPVSSLLSLEPTRATRHRFLGQTVTSKREQPCQKRKCPTCGKCDWLPKAWSLCSRRCKLVDLGKWFNQEHAISEPLIETLKIRQSAPGRSPR